MITWKAHAAGNSDAGRIDWVITSDNISSSTWTLIDAAGLTLGTNTFDDTSTTVKFSGGTAGLAARLQNTITTVSGRTFIEVVRLPIYDAQSAPLVTLDEAKAHLKLEVGTVGEDDDLIEAYIEAAVSNLDGQAGSLGRSLRPQTVEVVRDSFGADPIKLPYGPILGDLVVKYIDADGVEQTLDATTYALASGPVLRLAYGKSWPTCRADPDAVTITYRAGYDGNLPGAIRAAILLIVGDLYSNREANSVQAGSLIINPTVEALLAPYRVWSV